MPMLGGVATAMQQRLARDGDKASLGPAEWLQLCTIHNPSASAMDGFISMCVSMSDTFPELEVAAASEEQLQQLGDIAAAEPGKRYVNTLCTAAACGNASVARYIAERWQPDLSSARSVALLADIIRQGAAEQPEPEPEPEHDPESDNSDPEHTPDTIKKDDEEAPASWAVPRQFAGEEGEGEQEEEEEEEEMILPSVMRGGDDDDDPTADQMLLQQQKGRYDEVAALLVKQGAVDATRFSFSFAHPEPEPEPHANGYGVVPVDLAAEQAALRAQNNTRVTQEQVGWEAGGAIAAQGKDKPPPTAMKRNVATGELEEFRSPALQDDLPEEEEIGKGEAIELPCGDDY